MEKAFYLIVHEIFDCRNIIVLAWCTRSFNEVLKVSLNKVHIVYKETLLINFVLVNWKSFLFYRILTKPQSDFHWIYSIPKPFGSKS